MKCPICTAEFTNTLILDVVHYGEDESYIRCPKCKEQSSTFEWTPATFKYNTAQEEYITILEENLTVLNEKIVKYEEIIAKQEKELTHLKEYLLKGTKIDG